MPQVWYDTYITTLIATIFLGLIIAFFATQNTGSVTLNLLTYSLSVPMYIVVIGSLLLGLLFSWIIIIPKNIITGFAMRGKEHKITDYKKENAELLRQIHQLEITNARLETAANLPSDTKSL
ncbi:MAG TPA: lipopolysaccharide assembly protein LapA domain-containing protein [Candidatus Levybacteria bacterium]|nr:lipopolysaccharide assembly protein LapA domain-containing protein [Candidatus Levybacteria bacterium]